MYVGYDIPFSGEKNIYYLQNLVNTLIIINCKLKCLNNLSNRIDYYILKCIVITNWYSKNIFLILILILLYTKFWFKLTKKISKYV